MEIMNLKRKVSLISKIVLVDGQGRSGKSLLGPVIGSFDSVEVERIEPIYEYIAILDNLGKIDRDAAIQIIQLRADAHLYESMISRNTNFRLRDHSSIFNNYRKWHYLKKLLSKEGQIVVNEIQKKQPILQIQTHDALSMVNPFFEAFGNKLRVLQMLRHPTTLIYSWYNRGWGRRITEDPRSFDITIESSSGEILPWYTVKKYHELSEVDRIVQMISYILDKSHNSYCSLTALQKEQVCWIIFEDFVTDPEPDIIRIENCLGTKRTRYTRRQLSKENCPRIFDEKSILEKKRFLLSEMSEESLQCYNQLCEIYRSLKQEFGH